MQSCYLVYCRLMVAGALPGTLDVASLILYLLQGSQRGLCFPGNIDIPLSQAFLSSTHELFHSKTFAVCFSAY